MITPPESRPSAPVARSRLGRRIAQLYLAMLVLAPLVEIGARAYERVRWGTPWLSSPDYTRDLTIHDSLGVRGRPNGRYQKWHLNGAGFRSPETALESRAGCTRVMVFGASETLGYAEPEGQEYPAQLADSLRGRGCFEVINASVMGLSMAGIDQLWRLWGSRFSPDVVVVLANPSLYLADEVPVAPRPTLSAEPPRGLRPRALSVLRDLAQYPAFIQERRIERMVERLTAGKDSAWFFEGAPPERVERFARDVDSLATHVRAVGARLVVVNHPIKFRSINDPGAYAGLQGLRQFGARALPETILAFDSAGDLAARRVAERQGADFVNARAVMSGKPELFADPVHYSPLGAAVLAGEIARAIHAPAH